MVIVGGSGGEFSLRGRVTAYDAKTGKQKWRFWTIPGPGETGHDTWPADTDAWKTGGAPVWQTPAVDPELGLLYFSTGNASPDLNGSKREGDNLFTASIVAVDAETGKYRWHFQQVHHDIWDYDGPSPVVLFDVDGKKGLAQASKTGWLYLLDRETGEPLLPIPEKPVPQLASQKTAKTQPIPSYPPFIPQEVTAENVQNVSQLKLNGPSKNLPVKAAKEMYTPFDDKAITVVVPGPQGGTNWQPTSYNPETEMFYVCAQAAFSGLVLSHAGRAAGQAGLGRRPRRLLRHHRVRRSPRLLQRDRRPHGRDQVAEALAGVVLLGLGHDRRRARLRRPQQRRPGGLRRGERRRAALELPDRRRRQQHRDGLRAGRHAVPGLPRRRQRARGDARTGTTSGSSRSTARWTRSRPAARARAPATPARPRPSRRGRRATPPRARPSGPTTAPAATASPARAATAARASSTTRTRPIRPRCASQVTNGGGGMPAFKDTLTQQQINDVAAYVSQDIAKQ